MQDPVWRQLLEASVTDTKAFASTFMGETFFRPFSAQAHKIFQALDSGAKKVLIIAHRGLGKTSIAKAAALKWICLRQHKFIVTVSATANSAELNAANLQAEIVGNPMVLNVFGDLKNKDNWSKQQYIAGDTYVLPRGAGQQIRGLNFQNKRPQRILIDDLETSEGVASEEQRFKLAQWFHADLCNSVDRGSDDWQIVVIGTLLHEDSLIANLKKDKEWFVVEIPLCDDNLVSYYPEFMNDVQVRALYENMRDHGQADVFAREYQNKPISGLNAVFKQEYWKDNYYNPHDLQKEDDLFFVTILDPAKTVNLTADDSAIVTVGVDLKNHKLYFHDCVKGKMAPDQIYDAFFQQIVNHKSRMAGYEVTSLHEFISQPLLNEARKRGIYTNFIELKARAKKELRIAQLAPFYRQRYIYHNKAVSAPLELQLIDFPRAAKDDVADAFAYVIELMELNESYFYAPTTPDEDEYAALEKEPDMTNSWRTISL